MYFARAMGCEGIMVGVYLGGPEKVRLVLGTVDGVQESARLLLCLFEHGRERRQVLVSLTFFDSDAGDDRGVCHWSSSRPVCLDSSRHSLLIQRYLFAGKACPL